MTGRVVVLTGGVGGAKLVLGLTRLIPPGRVTAIVNTGDDFSHLGLAISPDLDTLLYTLAGKSNLDQGWGRAGETWGFMAAATSLGAPDWFALGDGDLALHVLRTERLRHGETLSAVTADFARSWGVDSQILPMSDDTVRTMLTTDAGDLDFQHYFVARRCTPAVSAIRFDGAAASRPAPGVLAALGDPAVRAILIAPSNPYLSIDPILAVPGVRAALAAARAPVVAISPIIGGKAVKGPTAKLMAERGVAVTQATIAAHYRGMIRGLLIDRGDEGAELGVAVAAADTLMLTLADRVRVAGAALALADRLR